METNLEEIAKEAHSWIVSNKRALFFLIFGFLVVWLLIEMKEITLLLILSYTLAVLFNPLARSLMRKGMSHSGSLLVIMTGLVTLTLLFFFVLLPPVVQQYAELVTELPNYARRLGYWAQGVSHRFVPESIASVDSFVDWVTVQTHDLRPEHLKQVWSAVINFLLEGYSITLTVLNLALLPFFFYYLSLDLRSMHEAIGQMFEPTVREKLKTLAHEILQQVYAFLRGQITVSGVMAVMYAFGLAIVGVPSGLAIGFLAGILNIVPYLGVLTGLILSIGAVLVSDPSWTKILSVLAVFGVVQFIEGTFLTPRIVGHQTGISPLGVMLALLVGGQLFGLIGLIIAIPIAAAIKVILKFLWQEVREENQLESHKPQ